jgi:hypothetical protein
MVLVCDCYCETHIIYIFQYIYIHGTRVSSDPMFHYQRVLENQPSSTQLPPCSVATTSMMFSKAVKKIWFPYGVTTYVTIYRFYRIGSFNFNQNIQLGPSSTKSVKVKETKHPVPY